MPTKFEKRLEGDFESRRLDVALNDLKVYASRAQGKRAIENGHVTVNGEVVKAGAKVKSGDLIEATIPDLAPGPEAEDIPLDIVYEDDDLVVVDKPAGIVVHPAAGNRSGTMVNALLGRIENLSGIGGVIRPGVVHRLDKDTSGIIVFAKHDLAHQYLTDQFRNRLVKKVYLAIIIGRMPKETGVIESAIARDPRHRTKMRGGAQAGTGREATTAWRVLETYPGASLIELTPKTGRTHQLRVHLSEAGHPIVGDKVYGTKRRLRGVQNLIARNALEGMNRQALHAYRLTLTLPSTGGEMTFVSATPKDMASLRDELRNAAKAENSKPPLGGARPGKRGKTRLP